jgi:hypothetical protein
LIYSVSTILCNCRSKDAVQAFSCSIHILANPSIAEYLAGVLEEKDSDLGAEPRPMVWERPNSER